MRIADAARPSPWIGFGAVGNSLLTKAANVIVRWRNRARDRQLLSRLNGHYLRDVGLTHQDVMLECSKPFWRE